MDHELDFSDQSKSMIGDYLSDRLQKVILNNQTESDWITLVRVFLKVQF